VDILVLAAHADDIELSAGATIAKAVREGQRVGLVDLTRGEMGTRGTPRTRVKESQNASAILGASFRLRLDFGDGVIRSGREQELELIEVIRRHRPSLLIGPYPDDRHPDHRRSGNLVSDCWFYAGLKNVITESPAHRPQAIIYYLLNYPTVPSLVVDVTETWETKMRAIAAFKSQFYDPKSKSKDPQTKLSQKSFLDMIEARGRYFGALIGSDYGEAYYSKQPPRVDDLVAAYRGREMS